MIRSSFRRNDFFRSLAPDFAGVWGMLFLCLALSSCSGLKWKPRGMEGAERWLSADTVAMVRLPNVVESRVRWSATAMGKGWSDPAVEYWRSLQFDPALEAVLERAGLGDSLEILDLIRGQAILSVRLAPLPEEEENPKTITYPDAGFVVIADFGENAAKARELIEKNAKGKEKTPDDLKKAVPDILLHTEPFAPAAGDPEWELASAWIDETWVLSSSPEDLYDLLRRRMGILRRGAGINLKKSLRGTDGWRKTAPFRRQGTDAVLYIDTDRMTDVLLTAFERNMRLIGRPEIGVKTRAILDWMGLDNLEAAVKTVEIRDKGFFSREAILLKGDRKGLLVPMDSDVPLTTDKWMTRDLESYMATRMRPPLEFKKSLVGMLDTVLPEAREGIKEFESRFETATGIPLDRFFGALGSEAALISRPSAGMPDTTLLIEIRDARLLDQSLEAFEKALKSTARDLSYRGYHYQAHAIPSLPLIQIRTARIDNFLMVSIGDAWFKRFIDFRKHGEETAKNPDLAAEGAAVAVGLQPLLPLLDEPFEEVAKGMTVVRRGYEDPRASMLQMNMYLPLLRPMVNLQLKMMDLPTIPSYVVSAIPPLLPFANEMFPTVVRTSGEGRLVVTESWSAFDPVASPFAAAVFIIVQKALMESK